MAKELARLKKALEILRDLKAGETDITVASAVVFVAVGMGPVDGVPQSDLERLADLSQATVSRSVMALSDFDRFKKPGPNLLSRTEDFENRKRKIIKLTAKGKRVAEQLRSLME